MYLKSRTAVSGEQAKEEIYSFWSVLSGLQMYSIALSTVVLIPYGSQIHIFDNYIPFSVRMKEAVREGQSIFSYDPKGKATEAYRRVTEEVLKDAI